MSLLDKLSKGHIKNSSILSESKFFNENTPIPTDLPILNAAFSGDLLKGGITPGLAMFAGESKTFKSFSSLFCVKAYLNHDPNAICLFYDSEFGTNPGYMRALGIDTDRLLHIPVENIEDLKFDVVERLKNVERGDKVIILMDSIGNLASKKEVEDAENAKSVADMSRAKAIKSLFRILTPMLTVKSLPCITINHTYQTMDFIPKTVTTGGSGLVYSANTIFIFTKAQIKDGTDLQGYTFTINIEKSRFVREKSKFKFDAYYGDETPIRKWSGLFDLALEMQYIASPTRGFYQIVNQETGELEGTKRRRDDIANDDEVWCNILHNTDFNEKVKRKYCLSSE